MDKIIAETRAYACLDCGKCTVACPIASYDPDFSPRQLVASAIGQTPEELLHNRLLWECISCGMCQERCKSGVDFTGFIKALREVASGLGESGQCTHGGAMQALMSLMTAENLDQNRLSWVGKNLDIATEADVVYFVGCQPYYDIIFGNLGVKTLDTARGAIKLLNRLDIVPALLPNERCCGHDRLWAGDIDGLRQLAEYNIKEIEKTGAKKVVTTCAEGYLTLNDEYPRHFGKLSFEVVHITQLLAAAIAEGRLSFKPMKKKVTYQDPCRLGRLGGIYDEPRAIINAIPEMELLEMPRNRSAALCCGTQAWMNCGAANRQIQAERLREAKATGAKTLVTACPKCQIHLACAMHDTEQGKELEMEITDLTSLAARALAD